METTRFYTPFYFLFILQVAMFGVGIERPPWDGDNKYHPHRMCIYYEDRLNVSSDPKLVKTGFTSTVSEGLKADPLKTGNIQNRTFWRSVFKLGYFYYS